MGGYMMMPIVGAMVIVALVLAVFQQQANAQPQQENEMAVVGLFEEGASGYTGIATLRSTDGQQQATGPAQQQPVAGQTEVIVGILSEDNGLFDIFDQNDEDETVRTAAFHLGTCDEVGGEVFQLGNMMKLGPEEQQEDQQEREIRGQVYAVRGMVEARMDVLLLGQYVLVVFEQEVDEEDDEEEEPQAIACGMMHPDLRMAPAAPMP